MGINFDFSMDTSLEDQLSRLENSDEVAMQLLEAVSPDLVQALKNGCAAHQDSGAMVNSIQAKGPEKNQYGHIVFARPTGKDKKGTRNMQKLAMLEHGYLNVRAGRYVAPKPVVQRAVNSAESAVLSKMQRKFEEITGI